METKSVHMNFVIPQIYGSESILFFKNYDIKSSCRYSVSQRIKYARLTSKKTSKQLALDIGTDISTYSRYETGKITENNMSLDLLKRIALACNFDEYFCFDDYQLFKENSDRYIKEYMKENKLTNQKAAEKFKVSLTTIKAWRAKKYSPSLQQWEAVFKSYCKAKYLDVFSTGL